MTASISIKINFSKRIEETVKQGIKEGTIKDQSELLMKLATVYQETINKNNEFMKPLKTLDPNVKVTIEVDEK